MSHAGWKDVLDLALALIARQSAPTQIFLYLALAFTALMVAEGLRANFFPWRSVVPRRDKRGLQSASDARNDTPREHASASADMTILEVRPRAKLAVARHVKRPNQGIRKQRPMRPQIKRLPPLPASEPQATQVFEAVNEDMPAASDVSAPVAATAEV